MEYIVVRGRQIMENEGRLNMKPTDRIVRVGFVLYLFIRAEEQTREKLDTRER
jgi:hypothetical protein